jgi:hypothetical protein
VEVDRVCECVAHLKNSLQAATATRTSGVFEGPRRYCGIIPDYTRFHTNEISLKSTAISERENKAQKLFYCTRTFWKFF